MAAKTAKIPIVDPWTILEYPHLSEKSIGLVESQNRLVFMVDERATKTQIRWAVQKAFDVKVTRVTTLNDRENRKKAFVTLDKKNKAADIATRLGML